MDRSCSTCTTQKSGKILQGSSFLSVLLVVILPKCPICIMAYASAISVCGGPDMYFAENNWVSFVPLVLGVGVITLLFFNYKGWITIAAVIIAITGWLLILATHQLWLSAVWYNAGSVILFLAIWINGSLRSFLTAIRNRLMGSRVNG